MYFGRDAAVGARPGCLPRGLPTLWLLVPESLVAGPELVSDLSEEVWAEPDLNREEVIVLTTRKKIATELLAAKIMERDRHRLATVRRPRRRPWPK